MTSGNNKTDSKPLESLRETLDQNGSNSSLSSSNSLSEENLILNKAMHLFVLPKEDRTIEDRKLILDFLKSCKPIIGLKRENINFNELLQDMIEAMNLEYHHKGEAMFHHGDRATKCYIILKGRVDFYTPKSPEDIIKEIKEYNLEPKSVLFGSNISINHENSNKGDDSKAGFETLLTIPKKRRETVHGHLPFEKSRRSSSIIKSVKVLQKITSKKEELHALAKFKEYKQMYFESSVVKFKKVYTLNPGDVFGEEALLSINLREVTTVAATDLQVMTISKITYENIVHAIEKNMDEKWKFFAKLTEEGSKETTSHFCRGFREERYKYGQNIFMQGEVARDVFIVKEGEVQILKYDTQDDQQEVSKYLLKKKKNPVEKKIMNVGPCSFLGEGLLSENLYNYTAKALTNNTVVYVLSIQEFKRLKRKYPELWTKVLKNYHTKTSFYESRVLDVSQVHEKIEEQNRSFIKTESNRSSRRDSIEEKLLLTKIISSQSNTDDINEENRAQNLLERRKSKFHLPLKIHGLVTEESGETQQFTGRSSTNSNKLESFLDNAGESDSHKSGVSSKVFARRDSRAGFLGGQPIQEIVESKFKTLQQQKASNLKSVGIKVCHTEGDEPSFPFPSIFSPPKKSINEKSSTKFLNYKEGASPTSTLASSANIKRTKPFEINPLKSKAKGTPTLRLKVDESEIFMPVGKASETIRVIDRVLSKKMATEGDDVSNVKSAVSFRLADSTSLISPRFDNQIKSSRLSNLNLGSPKNLSLNGVGTMKGKSLTSRKYQLTKLEPLTPIRAHYNTLGYTVSNVKIDMAGLELQAPFSTKSNTLFLSVNNIRTVDMVHNTSGSLFKDSVEALSSKQVYQEIQATPMSFRANQLTSNQKKKTIVASQHNLFRMKPNRLYVLTNHYKNEQTSPSSIRSKK